MIIQCPNCQNVLAVIKQSGSIESKRKGRVITARHLESITCEECQAVWKPEREVVKEGEVYERLDTATGTRAV